MYKQINTESAEQYGVSIDAAQEWIDHRILKKSKPTQRAFERFMKKALQVAMQVNMTPDQVVETCIDRGWLSIEAEWLGGNRGQVASQKTRGRSVHDDLNDKSWAH